MLCPITMMRDCKWHGPGGLSFRSAPVVPTCLKWLGPGWAGLLLRVGCPHVRQPPGFNWLVHWIFSLNWLSRAGGPPLGTSPQLSQGRFPPPGCSWLGRCIGSLLCTLPPMGSAVSRRPQGRRYFSGVIRDPDGVGGCSDAHLGGVSRGPAWAPR